VKRSRRHYKFQAMRLHVMTTGVFIKLVGVLVTASTCCVGSSCLVCRVADVTIRWRRRLMCWQLKPATTRNDQRPFGLTVRQCPVGLTVGGRSQSAPLFGLTVRRCPVFVGCYRVATRAHRLERLQDDYETQRYPARDLHCNELVLLSVGRRCGEL